MASADQSCDDDFTFPSTTAATSSSATIGFDSPPLWHLSPATSPPHRHPTKQCTSSNTPTLSDKNLDFHDHAHTTQYPNSTNNPTVYNKKYLHDHVRTTTQYTSSGDLHLHSREKVKTTPARSNKNLDLHLHSREKTNTTPTCYGKNLDLERRDDHEEKMDMLWEDFNEELTAVAHHSNKPRVHPAPGHRGSLLSPKRHAVSTMNRSNSGKMIVKVLKTMFLLPSHNHHQHYGGGGGLFRPAVKIKTNRS